jgi:hypothetical protein
MAEEKHRIHIGRIGIIVAADDGPHVFRSAGAGNVMAQNRPTVPDQILLQPGELGLQS